DKPRYGEREHPDKERPTPSTWTWAPCRTFGSGRIGEGAGTPVGGSELGASLGARLRQRAAQPLGVEVGDVDRTARLLAPGLVERAGVVSLEAELVDQPEDDLLVARSVPGHRQCDPARGPGGASLLQQA